jgi:hypothetical protein
MSLPTHPVWSLRARLLDWEPPGPPPAVSGPRSVGRGQRTGLSGPATRGRGRAEARQSRMESPCLAG